MSLRLAFAGTPVFAARHLEALLLSEHEVCVVYTQPDRPAGRGKKVIASPVKQLAEQHGITVEQPLTLKSQGAQEQLAAYNCDLLIVVAYGLLLPQAVLDTPVHGCINVHGSILPRWRGAAPIQRAIEAGDTHSGITIMQMDAGLDTGDMLLVRECAIMPRDSSGDLHDRLCDTGPSALLETLSQIANGTTMPRAQDDSQSTYARKIEKHEAEIDWTQSAIAIDRQIRAFNPSPICFSHIGDARLRIHAAELEHDQVSATPGQLTLDTGHIVVSCGSGHLRLTQLQLAGKKTMNAEQFVNGFGHMLKDTPRLGRASSQ